MAGKFTENVQTYIEVNDCLLTTASLTDKEILDSVIKTEDQEQGDEEDETEEPEPPPSIKEALVAPKLLEMAAFEFISRIQVEDQEAHALINLTEVTLPPGHPVARLHYDPRDNRDPKVPIKIRTAYFNLLRAMFGAGVLAMPLAISQSGLIAGPCFALFIIIIMNYTHHMLLWSLNEVCSKLHIPYIPYRYGFRIAVLHGPKCLHLVGRMGPRMIAMFMFMSQIGICSVFVIFVADSMRDVFDLKRTHYILLGMFLPFLGLVFFMKNLKIIGYTSMIGNSCMLAGMGITMYFIFTGDRYGEYIYSTDNIAHIMFSIGILLFNHSSIGVVLSIDKALPDPNVLIKPLGILNIGMIIPGLFGMIFGILGYWKFGVMEENVLRSLPFDDVKSDISFCLYSTAVAMTYPVHCFSAVEILLEVYKILTENRKTYLKITTVDYILRAFFVVITFAVIACIPFQGPFVSFVGSLCTSQLTLVFPALMELGLRYPGKFGKFKCHLIKDIMLIVLGLFISLCGVTMSVYIIVLRTISMY